MSYSQGGGSIIHLPGSTHVGYSSATRNSHASTTSTTRTLYSSYGTVASLNRSSHGATTTPLNRSSHGVVAASPVVNNYSSHGAITTAPLNNNYSAAAAGVVLTHPDSGNLSVESRDSSSLREAGEIVLRRKPDIGVIVSILSFLVWLRLFQAMFYSSALGNLEGFVKELLMVLLVWIPSISLTCFYFRSDDYQQRFRLPQ